jgi:hypothetical protein
MALVGRRPFLMLCVCDLGRIYGQHSVPFIERDFYLWYFYVVRHHPRPKHSHRWRQQAWLHLHTFRQRMRSREKVEAL